MDPETRAVRQAELAAAAGRPVLVTSGASGEGVPQVLRAAAAAIRTARAAADAAVAAAP